MYTPLTGVVVRGAGRGRALLGTPTANLALLRPDALEHRDGVYAGYAYTGGVRHRAVLSIGTNPTYTPDATARSVEVHLLGEFNANLYASVLRVEPLFYLRAQQRFAGTATLRNAIARDIAHAQERLGALEAGPTQ